MSTLAEVKAAIEKLSKSQVEELTAWLETVRVRRATPPAVEHWLERARGAAVPGATTAGIMAITRGEE